VNSKTINPPRNLRRILSQTYKEFNSKARFIAIINLKLPPNEYDINLSPDKRDIVFQNEEIIFSLI